MEVTLVFYHNIFSQECENETQYDETQYIFPGE
jgi:hypothetical protein